MQEDYSGCSEIYYRFDYLVFDPLYIKRGSVFTAEEQWAKSWPPSFLPPDLPMIIAVCNVPTVIGDTWCEMIGGVLTSEIWSQEPLLPPTCLLVVTERATKWMGKIFKLKDDPVVPWTAIVCQLSQSNLLSHFLSLHKNTYIVDCSMKISYLPPNFAQIIG